MGIIVRQSLKGSLVNFVGIGIAAISVLFIYPKYTELYGLAQFLLSTASLMIPFVSLGILGSLTKFFPRFKTEDNTNNGFLALTFISFIVLFILFSIGYISFNAEIITWLNSYSKGKAAIDQSMLYALLFLCFFVCLNYIYGNYAANYQRIVIPQIITQLLIRVYLPVAIILTSIYSISHLTFSYCLLGFFVFQILALHIYLLKLGVLKFRWPNWEFINKSLRKKILHYNLFATFNQFGSVLAFRIDMFMIPLFLNYSQNGVYAIMLFISNVIEIPARSVIGIADPIISKAWADNNMKEIETIYKKSTLNLMIPGIAVFSLIWFGFEDIASLSSSPDKLLIGKFAFLFLGLGKLFDLLTSVNNQIIIYSPKYKYNLVFIILLGLINVLLNYNLIQNYGITGAAFASFSAYFMYNIAKLFFIYNQFQLQPFTKEVLKLILIGAVVMGILAIIPNIANIFLSLFIKTAIICLIYFPTVYFLKLSVDLNNVINLLLQKVKNWKNNR